MARRGIEGLRDDLRQQRDFLARRVPAYARLLDELAGGLDRTLGAELGRTWRDRTFSSFYHRPLLLLAALRYDALCDGTIHPLWAAIVAEPPDAEVVTSRTVDEATRPGRERFWRALRERDVQTNETSRAVAWLLPAHRIARAVPGRRIDLVDLGASAGLNLIADELDFPWTDDTGAPLRLRPLPPVASRLGIDISPLDARDADSARWLLACTWPGDPARSRRLERAIDLFRSRAAEPAGPRVERGALADAAGRLGRYPADRCVLAVQTIVRDYLGRDERAAHAASMREWIRGRPPSSAVWIELEVDVSEPDPERSAVLTAQLAAPGGELVEIRLARMHPHPGRVAIDGPGILAFEAAVARPGP